FRNRSTARTSSGWRRSATSNTFDEPGGTRMKAIAASLATLSLALAATAQTPKGRAAVKPSPTLTLEDVRAVSPALGQYTERLLADDVWKRPDLTPRDRSVVTIAALIA